MRNYLKHILFTGFFQFLALTAYTHKIELKSLNDFHDLVTKEIVVFNPNKTIAVFDIDNTLTKQISPLNDQDQDFIFEYFDIYQELAKKMEMEEIKLWEFIKTKITQHLPKGYQLVEQSSPDFIRSLQDKGIPVITCTASTITPLDERLFLISSSGIDLTKNFHDYDLSRFSFFYTQNENLEDFFHPGHTSARDKAKKIDEVVNKINKKRSKKSVDLIDTVLFYDNRDDQVSQVLKNIKSVSNFYGFYYTHLKHHLKAEELFQTISHIKTLHF